MEKTVYEPNVPRVYTLYRVSTIGQVEKDDIPMQKQVCRDFAKKQGWVVVKEFSEKGISGYKVSAKDRDAIQEIQHDAALGKFDILLVFMFDRLGRRDDETPFIVEWKRRKTPKRRRRQPPEKDRSPPVRRNRRRGAVDVGR